MSTRKINIPKDLFTCPNCGRHYRFKEEKDVCEFDAHYMIAPTGGRGRISLPGIVNLHNQTARVLRVEGPVKDTRYEDGIVSTFQYVVKVEDTGEEIILFSDQLALVTPSYAPVKARTTSTGRIIGSAAPPPRLSAEQLASAIISGIDDSRDTKESRTSGIWSEKDEEEAIDIEC